MTLHLPVDHFVVLVRDLDAARAAFVAAGFTATPIARHSAAMGTANSCIMLDGSYIELMGMVADTPANEGWRNLLAAEPGLKGVALASDDIEATAAMLAAKGIAAEPPRHFARAMPEGELRFSVIRLPRALTPGLQCIYCQHHTRALLWTPDAMLHANGARRIVGAIAPGVDTLAPLAGSPAQTVPVSGGGQGAIAVAMETAISAERLATILTTSGIRIEPGAIT